MAVQLIENIANEAIEAFDLVLIEDDREVIPPYDALLIASPRFARERPALLASLQALDGAIDADTMRRMNLAVDREGASQAEVARAFLESLTR